MRMEVDPRDFDEGIRPSVLAFWKAGFKTFTCCEGGHGHSFRHPTIGVELVGGYFSFRKRLATFLHSLGCEVFDIIIMTSYDSMRPAGGHYVYVESWSLLTPEKYKRANDALRRRDARLHKKLNALEAQLAKAKHKR
jgi:hypothetical protein